MKYRNIILAWWSNLWGYCPECNSDAPELDNCDVCLNDRESPFKKERNIELWKRYKEYRTRTLEIYCPTCTNNLIYWGDMLNEDEGDKTGNYAYLCKQCKSTSMWRFDSPAPYMIIKDFD